MLTTDRHLDVTRAECLAWGSYAFWTLACACFETMSAL